jgi:hypothetical protein
LAKTGIAHEIIDMDLLDEAERNALMPGASKGQSSGLLP